VRHSRAGEFDEATAAAAAPPRAGRWSDVARDPNDAAALAERAATLRAAWREPIAERIWFLEDRCRGRRVLDIGCVAHDVARMHSSGWLHGRLAAAAATCVGVDVLAEGIEAMARQGYDVVRHDLHDGLGPLAERVPFDVIVAGELIEHVEDLAMLFEVATEVLATDGQLIITTPNPYAPHRVRAAQRGIVWENVDHIMYAFPSGIAELAERHGLVLGEARVTVDGVHRPMKEQFRAVRRWLEGRQWVTVGYATFGTTRVCRVRGDGVVGRWARRLRTPWRRFTGDTFVDVVRRPGRRTRSGNGPAVASDEAAEVR
jgi:2-polyprenyl-3-methyl-5-hydroxy-6-metoxy-1,4-benzoquinol methylase